MFCNLKVVVDFLRIVVCLLLSRPYERYEMKEYTKRKNNKWMNRETVDRWMDEIRHERT